MSLPRKPHFGALRWPWRTVKADGQGAAVTLPPTPAGSPMPAPVPMPEPKRGAAAPGAAANGAGAGHRLPSTTKAKGDAAEALAMAHLQAQGLRLLARNWRAPGRGGGELDLVMQASDGTLVFVEVRARRSASHGGAGESITLAKQQRTVRAARHYLQQWLAQPPLSGEPPPCRFDVVLVSGEGAARHVQWLRAAFDASA